MFSEIAEANHCGGVLDLTMDGKRKTDGFLRVTQFIKDLNVSNCRHIWDLFPYGAGSNRDAKSVQMEGKLQ